MNKNKNSFFFYNLNRKNRMCPVRMITDKLRMFQQKVLRTLTVSFFQFLFIGNYFDTEMKNIGSEMKRNEVQILTQM